MICIFCLSHVPALMFLDLDGFDNSNNILLLIFLIGVVQVSDVLQYVWGKLIGGAKSCLRFRHQKLFPALSAVFCRPQPLPR